MSKPRAAHFRAPNKENERRIGRQGNAGFPIRDSTQRRRREESMQQQVKGGKKERRKERGQQQEAVLDVASLMS